MKNIKDNGINGDVLGGLIIVQMVDVRQQSLYPTIPIPGKK
jgi:hypothetical protein